MPIIEDSLRPLFILMTNPKDVDFDDDLVFCAHALIKKSKSCSLMMQEFFPFLQLFQNKYEGMLANLTNCLNSYIVYGREFIEQSPEHMQSLINMVQDAISQEPMMGSSGTPDFSNNIEGCFVLSIAL